MTAIDWIRFDELSQDFETAELVEVVQLFVDEVEEAIATLHEIATPPAYADQLHFIEGGALNLGFAELAELCANRTTRPIVIADCFERSREAFLVDPRVAMLVRSGIPTASGHR